MPRWFSAPEDTATIRGRSDLLQGLQRARSQRADPLGGRGKDQETPASCSKAYSSTQNNLETQWAWKGQELGHPNGCCPSSLPAGVAAQTRPGEIRCVCTALGQEFGARPRAMATFPTATFARLALRTPSKSRAGLVPPRSRDTRRHCCIPATSRRAGVMQEMPWDM